MNIWRICGFVVAAVVLAACSGSSDSDTSTSEAAATSTTISEGPGSPGPDVSIENFFFGPASLAVSVGETVTWTNDSGGTNHTTTSADGLWDSESLSDGSTFTHTFDEAGTFSYFCSIHPSMTATVTVDG